MHSIAVSPILARTSIYRLRNYICGVPTNSDKSSFRHESPIHKHVSKNKSYLPELNSTRSGEKCLLKNKTAEERHAGKANSSKQAPKPSPAGPHIWYEHTETGSVQDVKMKMIACSHYKPLPRSPEPYRPKASTQNIPGDSRFVGIVSILQLLERADRMRAK